MDSISISVIIPAYNAGDFLSTAVQSVLNQSHRNLELLIIDDASTDATGQLAQVFAAQDARVRYHRNPSNTGVARSRNLGVSLARFDWIAFLDSDDRWQPDKLARQAAYLQRHALPVAPSDSAFTCRKPLPIPSSSGKISSPAPASC